METKRCIGIDLQRNCFTACLRLENGREYLKEWRLEDLDKFVTKLRPGDQLAVEVTGNTPRAVRPRRGIIRAEPDAVDQAMLVLQRIVAGSGRRRGRPPAWMSNVKRQGRTAGQQEQT